jgi:hypothetical protein
MDINTFYQSYIDLAYQVADFSKKPTEIEADFKNLKLEIKHYVDSLDRFEGFFDKYPALQEELLSNVSNHKVGAFMEFQLDLFGNELKRVEETKIVLQKEMAVLRNEFADKSKELLSETEKRLNDCSKYLDSHCVSTAIAYLNGILNTLKAKKEQYLSETKRPTINTVPEDNSQAEAEKARREKAEKDRLARAEDERIKEERRLKAQQAFSKSITNRKK